MRASDAERDEAVRALAAHYVDGRLDQPEFDRRTEAALTADTRDRLRGLFADLPDLPNALSIAGAADRPSRGPMAGAAPGWRPPFVLAPVLIAALLALAVTAVVHGFPPFPIIPLIFVLARRRRHLSRQARPWM